MREMEFAAGLRSHHVFDELEQAQRAARHFGARCVQRDANGRWRPTASWQGSRQATAAADREVRLRHAERERRAMSPDADRRRRLRLAELTLDLDTVRRYKLERAEARR
jgi:hypothetical protein